MNNLQRCTFSAETPTLFYTIVTEKTGPVASYLGDGISIELCVFSCTVEDAEWNSVGYSLEFMDYGLDEEIFKHHVPILKHRLSKDQPHKKSSKMGTGTRIGIYVKCELNLSQGCTHG